MSKPKTIFRNVFSNWVGFFSEACTAFLLAPLVIQTIGDTAYGIWVLMISVTGYFGLLNLGLRPAINKYVAEFNARQETARLNEIVNATLSLYTGIAVCIVLASVAVTLFLNHLAAIPPALLRDSKWVVLIIGFQFAASLPSVVFGGILSGLQRYDIHNAIGVGSTLLRAVLIVQFLTRYPSLLTLAWISFVTLVFAYGLKVWAALRLCPSLQIHLGRPPRQALVALFRYSSITVIIHLSGRLLYYADSFIVGTLISLAAVTHYAIAGNLVSYLRNLVEESANVLNPAASELGANGEMGQLQALWVDATKGLLAMTLPIALGSVFLGKEFIILWMGPDYAASATILSILAISQAITLPQYGGRNILYGLGRHRVVAQLMLLEAILSIGLSFSLGYKWGLVGVAVGFASAAGVFEGLWLPLWICAEMKMHPLQYFRKAYLPPLLSVIPLGLVLGLLTWRASPYGWAHLIEQILVGAVVYVPVVFFGCLTVGQRSKVFGIIRSSMLPRGAQG